MGCGARFGSLLVHTVLSIDPANDSFRPSQDGGASLMITLSVKLSADSANPDSTVLKVQAPGTVSPSPMSPKFKLNKTQLFGRGLCGWICKCACHMARVK